MTPEGRAYVVTRLTTCPDLAALKRVWGNLGHDYQRDQTILETKDRMKEQLS